MARRRIGYVGPSLSHPLSRALWQGLLRVAGENDDDVVLLSGGFINGIDRQANPRASSYRFACAPYVDGLVVYGAPFGQFHPIEEVRRFLASFSLPLVNIGLKIPGFPCVEVDDGQGLAGLVRHLLEVHGYQRFAWIGGPAANQESILRFQTVRSTLAGAGIGIDEADAVPGDFSVAAGRDGIRTLIDERGRMPQVVVCVDDDTAVGAIEELERRGFRVPLDVAVTGFDDSNMARSTVPSISTVHQDLEAEGASACQLLHDLLEGAVGADIRLPTRPVFRESCGCTTGSAALVPDPLLVRALAEAYGSGAEGFSSAVFRDLFLRGAGSNPDLLFQALGAVRPYLISHGEGKDLKPFDPWAARVAQVVAGLAVQREVALEVATEERYGIVAGITQELSHVTDARSFSPVLGKILATFDLGGACITRQTEEGEEVLFRHPPELSGLAALFQWAFENPSPGKVLIVEPLAAGPQTIGYLAAVVPVPLVFLGDILASGLGATFTRLDLIGQIRSKTLHLEETIENLESTKKKLAVAERLAALGQMVFGVAHELNTPLGNVLASASSLEEQVVTVGNRFRAGGLSRSDFEQFLADAGYGLSLVLRNNARSIDLVQQFKRVGMGDVSQSPTDFDLAALVRDALEVHRPRLLAAGIVLEIQVPDRWEFHSFPDAFVKILDQALDNVRLHAYPPGTPGRVRVTLTPLGTRGCTLEIRDWGRGLTEEALAQVFDPFYTDKRSAGMLGLGAHLVHNLVTLLLGGQVQAESRPGEGLCLTIQAWNTEYR